MPRVDPTTSVIRDDCVVCDFCGINLAVVTEPPIAGCRSRQSIDRFVRDQGRLRNEVLHAASFQKANE
jgi:hypothetical protein